MVRKSRNRSSNERLGGINTDETPALGELLLLGGLEPLVVPTFKLGTGIEGLAGKTEVLGELDLLVDTCAKSGLLSTDSLRLLEKSFESLLVLVVLFSDILAIGVAGRAEGKSEMPSTESLRLLEMSFESLLVLVIPFSGKLDTGVVGRTEGNCKNPANNALETAVPCNEDSPDSRKFIDLDVDSTKASAARGEERSCLPGEDCEAFTNVKGT